MVRLLAVVNQKGGVGKTTTSVNLAAALAQSGSRVLLVDLDPQGNATMGSGIDKRTLGRTVYHVLLGLAEAAAVRVRAERGGYDLLPANRELAGAEVELVELHGRETRLKSALEHVIGTFAFGGLPYPQLERSYKLFAEKVLPVLKNDPAFAYPHDRVERAQTGASK